MGEVRKRILVVEDDASYSMLLSDTLTDAGFAVDTAKNGEEALESMKTHPDMILLDYVLPDMTGVDILKKIRNEGSVWCSKVPVFLLTQKNDLSTMAEAIEGHMTGYIVKAGTNFSEVLEKVRRELE